MQFLTWLEKPFSPKSKVRELDKVTIGSLSYLGVHEPQKIVAPSSMGSMRL
jgi:hypothetical protein